MLKKFDTIDPEIVRSKWLDLNSKFGVYIHSPFCPSICKYCVYAGVAHNQAKFDAYYDNYLPRVIDFYRPVLEQKNHLITSWFFGGGTPSLIPPDKLDRLLASLPGFRDHPAEKTFELHPGAYNLEQFDVLQSHNFDNIILCQQTLDQDTLKEQKRVPSDLDNLVMLAEECRKRQFHIGLDIIGFLNERESDIEILKRDLDLTYQYIMPDEISVQALFHRKKDYTRKTIETLFESSYVKEKQYAIEEYAPFSSFETLEEFREQLIKGNADLKAVRLYKKSTNIDFNCTNYIEPGWAVYSWAEQEHNCLAIGSYKNPFTQSHSHIKKFNYFEINHDNEQPQFKYVTSSLTEEVDYIWSLIKQAGDPPPDVIIAIKTKFYKEKEIPLFLEFLIQHNKDDTREANYAKRVHEIIKQEEQMLLNKLKGKEKKIINVYSNRYSTVVSDDADMRARQSASL